MSVGVQLEHVEMPGDMIDEEAVINEVAPVAIINLRPNRIGKMHLLAAKFRKGKFQTALPLIASVIDDDVAVAVLVGPGIGNETV
jgi:hypothetical protein